MKTFKNPILPGFYPDPSVCRVGDEFFLVTSTFAYFPGVPIFSSRDLVNWKQVGNVLTRDSQLPVHDAETSRGIFAPTIRYNDGVFYMITTNVSHGGNFLVTATDPAGPWSEPFYLDAPGIDPSLYFEDGRCWYHGTREKPDGAYYGDNEIYLQELDLQTMKLIGERHVIWHCALKNAVWPEGPHIYKKNGWYYLMISEGGTAHEHAITIARSRTLTGYYEGHKGNPILTHRHLGREYPLANVGHGDLVETPKGEWFMVLLASRPYGGYFRNLGRETFLAPVVWEDDWPVVNYGIGLVRTEEVFPDLEEVPAEIPTAFDFRTLKEIPMSLLHLRNPIRGDYTFSPAGLHMRPNANKITDLGAVSFLCIRQQHFSFDVMTEMCFDPKDGEAAGLVIYQGHKFNYQLVLTRRARAQLREPLPDAAHSPEAGHDFRGAEKILHVVRTKDGEAAVIAEAPVTTDAALHLRISAEEQVLSFSYSADGKSFERVGENVTAKFLNTDTAGGFVGNTIGMYATSPAPGENLATFATLSYAEK